VRRLRLGFEKKNERRIQSFILGRCLELSVLLVALSAVDRFTRCRHKWHLRICAAVRTFDLRHLPRGTVASIPITHFVFHRPYFVVIQKTILVAIIGTSLTAVPSCTQVRSPVYCDVNMLCHYKNWFCLAFPAQGVSRLPLRQAKRGLTRRKPCKYSPREPIGG